MLPWPNRPALSRATPTYFHTLPWGGDPGRFVIAIIDTVPHGPGSLRDCE